ncbi:7526_t:CDS:2, partial [Racocetra fulgida]
DSPEQLPEQIGLRCNDTPASDITNNTSNSDVCQESSSQYPASPIRTEAKSSEDKEVDVFHDSIFNERVRKEKKLRDQEVSSGRQDTSEELMSSHPPSTNNDVSRLPAKDSNPEAKLFYLGSVAEQRHYHDKSPEDKAIDEFLDSEYRETVSKKIIQNIKEEKLRDQEKFITSQDTIPNISSEIKIPYNQKVERGLISELLEFIRSNDATIPQNSYSISGKQNFDLFKKNMTYVGDLTIGTTPYLAHVGLRQYAIEHGMDPEEFSIITEAERNRWAIGCFPADLERDIRFYRGGIESKEDPGKYREFLTDRERLVGEELLRRSMVKSGLSTAWLDNLMEEWEKTYNQFKFLASPSQKINHILPLYYDFDHGNKNVTGLDGVELGGAGLDGAG